MVRLKHRYLVGQVLFDPMGTTPTINTSASSSSCFPSSSTTSHTVGEISQRDLQYALGKELQRLFGDVGVGMFGLGTSFRYFDPRSYLYVVRTSREERREEERERERERDKERELWNNGGCMISF